MRWQAVVALIAFDARRVRSVLAQSAIALTVVLFLVLSRTWRNPVSWMMIPLAIVAVSAFFVPGVAVQDRTTGTAAYIGTLPFGGRELAIARAFVLAAAILLGAILAVMCVATISRFGALGWPTGLLMGLPPICVIVLLPISMLLNVLHARAPVLLSLATFGALSAGVFATWQRLLVSRQVNWVSYIPLTKLKTIEVATSIWLVWGLLMLVLLFLMARVLQPSKRPSRAVSDYLDELSGVYGCKVTVERE